MHSVTELIESLRAGSHDEILKTLYALDGTQKSLELARERAIHVAEGLMEFDPQPKEGMVALFSGPGRTEIGGNHTDHQHGNVLCGSVDLDMLACAAPNGTDVVRIISEGYPPLSVDLSVLTPQKEESNTSAALVRGIADRIVQLGYSVGGFDAYVSSTVLSGSGLSSSAAYEVLMGNIFNYFFCGSKLSPVEIAKIGQYAENVHFGKPCGLMDQTGSAVGSAVAIDFADPTAPIVRKVAFDFAHCGYALCIVDTGSHHADLTDDYADITKEMGAVSRFFGEKFLRDVPYEEFMGKLPELRSACGDRAVLRAIHYYDDNRRAVEETEALAAGDFQAFLSIVNASGYSSALHLQNTWSVAAPQQQAIPITLAIGRLLLGEEGAIRVHGGGFAGTIQAFVPNEKLEQFKAGMESLLGEGKCHVLHIRPIGGCVVVG